MSPRDRYDPGGRAAVERQARERRIAQERIQADCARRTIELARSSPRRSEPGTFEYELLAAFEVERMAPVL